MQIAHYSHLSVRRYTYPYAIFNGLSGKAVAKRPRARFSCCTMTTNLGETFRLALAALRSTVGDAKFCKIEKTWVQEHQEQFDPTGLKINATYSDKSTKAIDAAERRVQPAVQDRRQHGSDHRPDGTRTADGRRQRGHRMAVRRMAAPGALAVGQRRGRARHIDDDGGHRLVRGPAAAVMRGWWRPGFVRCRGAVSAGHSRTA